MNRKDPLKRFRIYWFTGDYWSGKDEKRHYCIIPALSESEAEYIFKRDYPDCKFGWVEEVKNENKRE